MRNVERERLEQLRKKKKSGETLTPKEQSRFIELVAMESRERSNENVGRNQGNNRPNAARGGDLSSVGSSQGSGEGLGESESAEQGNRSQLDSVVGTDNGNAGESRGQDRVSGGSSGSAFNDGGSVDGIDSGIDGSNQDSGDGGRQERTGRRNNRNAEEKEIRGLSALAPKEVKPKRQSSTKGKAVEISPADLYGAFISGTFSTIAFASGRPHWNISEEEAESIAKPLDTMLAKLSAKQKKAIEKYTAPAMLGMALAGVVVPRLMVDLAQTRRNKNVGSTNKTVASITNDLPTANVVEQHGGNPADVPRNAPNADKAIAGLFGTGN